MNHKIIILSIWVGLLIFPLSTLATESVLVFAAASTTDVVNAVTQKFTEETGIKTRASFAASSTLARQIERGAPAELYISANLKWMNFLAKKDLIRPSARSVLFSNSLVFITHSDTPVSFIVSESLSIEDYLGSGFISIADPSHTPVGMYAKKSLETLGLWKAIETHLARTKDVRSALTLVERKETPFGIVYYTDAIISKRVMIAGEFPIDSHPPIIYLAGIIGDSPNPAASELYAYLLSDGAKEIYKLYGFRTDIK